MEKWDTEFYEKYRRKYKMGYDWEDLGDGKKGSKLGCHIPSMIKPHKETGQAYSVYRYGKDTLAAVMPRQKATYLMKSHPFMILKTDADDCRVLLFPENMLKYVARDMRLRHRKVLSPENAEKARASLKLWREKQAVGGTIKPQNQRSCDNQ